MTELLYQGHGSFRLTASEGLTIYIDPFAGEGYDIPANLILVTHQHFDHNRTDLPPHAEGCIIYQEKDALCGGHYNTLCIGDITVEATEAYNKNHPKESCVGYLISIGKTRLYFAGDTSETEQMSRLVNIDYAFLPCDGIYNMGVAEAVKCAEIIGAKNSVPVHMSPSALFSEKKAVEFERLFKGKTLIIRPGETIKLP